MRVIATAVLAALVTACGGAAQDHHWDFGPMPKQPVSEDEVGRIIAYIRSVQRREGIAP